MKLVKILGKEMSEWPKGFEDVGQAFDGVLHLPGIGNHVRHTKERYTKSEDWAYAIVTRAQWQAERDRQTGGEWKRHRGGKCPVKAGTKVITRYRDGVICDWYMTRDSSTCIEHLDAIWSHSGGSTDIMAYKIEPQAEEVEVKDTTIGTLSYKVEIDTSEASQAIDELAAKWDQVDGPLRWRDCVNELDAYIEEFTRERESLINRLALEGFALIPTMTAVMGFTPISLPFGEWEPGDLVTSKVDYNHQFTKGKKYKVTGTNMSLGEKRVSVESDDKGKANGWLANQFEFHSRP